MSLLNYLRSIMRFRKTNVSLFLLLTYVIIGALYILDHTNYKHSVPTRGDDPYNYNLLETAWTDLQNITKSPHPYTSRDNDRVHDYLLDRVRQIGSNIPYADISDDYYNGLHTLFRQPDVFNATSRRARVIYYESSNIIVKLEGSDPKLPGLLLSAHFDSVPTSRGATDDGKGIASLLALLTNFCNEQPERTIIFNFNNNEEFGLLGAHSFFKHPWSNLVEYVINLEGTGTGGKSVLFRTSDISTASIYKEAVKYAPFGNSIYQQGFYNRYIGSETDYKVYEDNGLRGWDIAFYKPRDFYHTIEDSTLKTSKAALWHMLHTSLQLSKYIANTDADEHDSSPAIYFDLSGMRFFVLSSSNLFIWNCILLTLTPALLFLLLFLLSRREDKVLDSIAVKLRFPASLLISISLLYFTQLGLQKFSPLFISRNHLIPLIALTAEFILLNYMILSVFEYFSPSFDFKTIALTDLVCVSWLMILVATIKLRSSHYTYTGIYPLVILHICVLFGTLYGYIASLLNKRIRNTTNPELESNYGSVNADEINAPNHRTESINSANNSTENTEVTDTATGIINSNTQRNENLNVDERAPLLNSRESSIETSMTNPDNLKSLEGMALNYDWSLQFLLVVPLGTFIVFNAFDLILDALNQTVQESAKSSLDVMKVLLIGSILISLPVLPFVYRFNFVVIILFTVTFLVTISETFLGNSFTNDSPLKLRFSQSVNISNSSGTNAIVNVYGRQGGYIETLLNDLPSVKNDNKVVWCVDKFNGNEQCSYIGEQPNMIDAPFKENVSPRDLFSVAILKNDRKSSNRSPYEPINAELSINVKENRACTLEFFGSSKGNKSPVRQITIFHDNRNDSKAENFKLNSGIDELQLNKLDFDQESYHVRIQWYPRILDTIDDEISEIDDDKDIDSLNVKVSCFWGEYDSESYVGGQHRRKLPSYDELLEYAPLNVSFSNLNKGLLDINEVIQL